MSKNVATEPFLSKNIILKGLNINIHHSSILSSNTKLFLFLF